MNASSPVPAGRIATTAPGRLAGLSTSVLIYFLATQFAPLASAYSPFASSPSAKPGKSDEAGAAARAAERAWAVEMPRILKRIQPPTFPGRDFDITQFGAVGDGAGDCTRAFQDAIAACNQAGGGRVVVPAGKFLTGAIHLKNNVNLHVVKDGTVLFSTNPAAYLPVVFTRYECTEVMNYSPFIYAYQQQNVAITGEGTLDGQASAGVWYQWQTNWGADTRRLVEMGNQNVPVNQRVFGNGHYLRPSFIQPVRCRNVLIEGVRVINSPMWVITPLYCTNVTVSGVTVETRGPNTDGCDPDSCTDVLIKDCRFSNGDDCIAIKSGRDADGRRVNIPCRNIVVQNCVFEAGHGGVTCGSETAGGIKNVFAENCRFDSPDLDMALRFKTNPARGGYIENVHIRKGTVQTAKFGIHMTLRYGSSGARDGNNIPVMRNIDIRDCTFATLTKAPIFIEGYSEAIKIDHVTIADCTFEKAGNKSTITNADHVKLFNVGGGGVE
jgi:polygalacturonase